MTALGLIFELLLVISVVARPPNEWYLQYQVSVEVRGEFASSGAIISAFWVLTVASGLENVTSEEIIARVASPPVWRGMVHRVKEVVRHPTHQAGNVLDSNLALLKLFTRLTFSRRIHPITLWPNTPSSGSEGWVSGWIREQWINSVRRKSRVVQLPVVIIDSAQCIPQYPEQLMCAATLKEPISSYDPRDLGDLLVIKHRMAGFLLKQMSSSNFVFGAIGPHITWIKRIAFGLG